MSNSNDENLYRYIHENIENIDDEQAVVAVVSSVSLTDIENNIECFKAVLKKCDSIEINDLRTVIRLGGIEAELKELSK